MRKVPDFKSDQEAEAFLDRDLSGLDPEQFVATRFEFEPKSETVTMRVPPSLLSAVRRVADREGVPYQRFIRRAIESALEAADRKPRSRKPA